MEWYKLNAGYTLVIETTPGLREEFELIYNTTKENTETLERLLFELMKTGIKTKD